MFTFPQPPGNSWDNRRYLVRRAIRDHKPAIFGIQECLWDQGVELNEAFYGYRITGVGRDDGVQAGEMCLIFTRHDRYHLLDQGYFWLSETPEIPGSKGWDAACARIVTWVKLRDRWCNPDTLFVFNTHMDHVGEEARREGALLLQKRMAGIAGEASRGRIDWILTSAVFDGIDAGIERFHKNGRYPSDHFPVWATFRLERHPPMPGDEIDTSTGATPKY